LSAIDLFVGYRFWFLICVVPVSYLPLFLQTFGEAAAILLGVKARIALVSTLMT
jgi:hypothetical protein